MHGDEKRARPNQAPGQPLLAEMIFFYNVFHEKVLSELEKNGCAIFFPEHWWKMS